MRDAAERHRGREEERLARDDLLGRAARTGTIVSAGWRVQAASPASASDAPISFRNCAAADGVEQLARLARELAREHLLELGRAGELLEAAPVVLAAARRAASSARTASRSSAVGVVSVDRLVASRHR